MGILYPPTSAAIVPGAFSKFTAGARCPDFEFIKSRIVQIRFYELFNIAKFVIFKPAGMQLDLSPRMIGHTELWEVSKKDEMFEVTTPKGMGLATSFVLPVENDTAIVVRPDLYVGYVGPDVKDYFEFML